jgi:transcriptional regulator with XRE-family HTH domain
VRDLRQKRGWRAEDLAARCAEIGAAEMTRSVIANIETGRRDSAGRRRRAVTVEEWLILAFALDVSPAELLGKGNWDETIAVTSSTETEAGAVASWIAGNWPSPVAGLLGQVLAGCGTCDRAMWPRRRSGDGDDDEFVYEYVCVNQDCRKPAVRRRDLVDRYVIEVIDEISQDFPSGNPSFKDSADSLPASSIHKVIRAMLRRAILFPVPQPELQFDPASVRLEFHWSPQPAEHGSA